MMRFLLAWLLCWPLGSFAALEEWPCYWLADYYANVAVDRDMGMSSKERNNKTVRNVIRVMAGDAGVDIEAEDAQALLGIVEYVYLHQGTAAQIRRDALHRCFRGQREAPPVIQRPMRGGT